MFVFYHPQIPQKKSLLTTPFTDPALIPGPTDLGSLQSLRTIALSFTIKASAGNVFFPMCTCGLFKPPTSPTQLKNIEIQTQLDRLRPGKRGRQDHHDFHFPEPATSSGHLGLLQRRRTTITAVLHSFSCPNFPALEQHCGRHT